MNNYICNKCGYEWYQKKAETCMKCGSTNLIIELEDDFVK